MKISKTNDSSKDQAQNKPKIKSKASGQGRLKVKASSKIKSGGKSKTLARGKATAKGRKRLKGKNLNEIKHDKEQEALRNTVNNVEADVELQVPDVAFIRTSVDAAYMKKPAHLRTRKNRYEAGRAMRVRCPRESHAEYKVAARRVDPIKLLVDSSEGRLTSLLPIRYGRMIASPFSFF